MSGIGSDRQDITQRDGRPRRASQAIVSIYERARLSLVLSVEKLSSKMIKDRKLKLKRLSG